MTTAPDQLASDYISISWPQFLTFAAVVFFEGSLTVTLFNRFPRDPGD